MSNVKGFHRCEKTRATTDCKNWATVYALDSGAGDWGGRYCDTCAALLGWQVVDHYGTEIEEPRPYGDQGTVDAMMAAGLEPDESRCVECDCPVGEHLDADPETGHDRMRWTTVFHWPDGSLRCEDCTS